MAVLTYQHYAESVDQTSPSYADVPIGTASASRVVVVSIAQRNVDVLAVHVGGVSATLAVEDISSFFSFRTEIWYATVPVGSTTTIVVTTTGQVRWQSIGVYTGDAITLLDVAQESGSACELTTVNGGGHVALIAHAGTLHTWTNATSDFAEITDPTDADDFAQGASGDSEDGSTVITASGSPGAAFSMCAASFSGPTQSIVPQLLLCRRCRSPIL